MKKSMAIVLAAAMLVSLAFLATGCKVAEVTPIQGGSDAQIEDAVVAQVGDEVVSLAEYQTLFDSYSSMYSMYGMDVTADPTQLAVFQDSIINTLLQEAVVKYQSKKQGFDALTPEQETEAKAQLEETIEEMRAYYADMAQQELQKDPTLDVDQYVEDRILEEAQYYTGESMDMAKYTEWMREQVYDSYKADLLKQSLTADVTLSDGALQNWYDETLASEKARYTEDPGAYKDDEEHYELDGAEDGAMPVVYVPEGYYRIMDIQVLPKTTASELYEEYDAKIEKLDTLSHEYGERAFANALENSNANDGRLSEILAEYKTLKAETDGMEEEALKDAKAIIEEAYAKLEAGSSFESLQLRYTENPDLIASENFMMRGMLIHPKEDSVTDWPDEIKFQFSNLAVGAYSPIFMADGSYHIIYNAGEEPAGARPLEDVSKDAEAVLLSEIRDEEWQTLIEAWMQDDSVQIFEEVYRAVGVQG